MNYWIYYFCRIYFYILEVVVGKVWINVIEVNKVINMKEVLMYMYIMKEILVDYRFMEID